MILTQPKCHCRVFEGNNSYITITIRQKFPARTKHIAVNTIIRWYVKGKLAIILYTYTNEWLADIFVKPLDDPLLLYLILYLVGW